MDKQNVTCTHNGILLSPEKKWNFDTRLDINKPWNQYANWNKPDTKGQTLYDSSYRPRILTFIETEGRMVVTRGPGEREWRGRVEWVRIFSLGRWKISGEGWRWWLHNSVNVLNATELPTSEWLKWPTSRYVYFTPTKNDLKNYTSTHLMTQKFHFCIDLKERKTKNMY